MATAGGSRPTLRASQRGHSKRRAYAAKRRLRLVAFVGKYDTLRAVRQQLDNLSTNRVYHARTHALIHSSQRMAAAPAACGWVGCDMGLCQNQIGIHIPHLLP